ncbi:MAG: hypothetical protein KDA45_13670, partial [Planctomycetales bacterium]|nr:hypothetical protein [Planctomycetales bacterium]
MFALRRRWPLLAAAIAALTYLANNYTISGLDQLQLTPKEQASTPAPARSALSTEGADSFGFDWTQFGIQQTPVLGGGHDFALAPGGLAPSSPEPAWSDHLSVGEKLAVWQNLMSPPSSPPVAVSSPQPTLPISNPIPAPQGLTPSRLPHTGGTQFFPSGGAPPSGTPVSTSSAGTGTGGRSPPATTIRLATFHIPLLGPNTLAQPHVVQTLVTILRQYDVVAVQGLQTSRDDVLPLLIDKLNQAGRSYDYMVGPRVGRTAPQQQFAFLFDTSKLETDRYQLYTIDDPEDLMNYEPLVAWFRCRGVPSQAAFTFSLINVCIDPSFAEVERGVLPQLIEAIERDGRHEDDWIMAGNFAGGSSQLTMLDGRSVRYAVRDAPTDVAGTQMLSLLFFPARATTEFTGRAGAFDFLRKYNLSIERAQ